MLYDIALLRNERSSLLSWAVVGWKAIVIGTQRNRNSSGGRLFGEFIRKIFKDLDQNKAGEYKFNRGQVCL